MATVLSRDEILNKDDIQQENVSVPEWDGDVIVRGLNGYDRDRYEESMVERRGKSFSTNLENIRARLVSLCVVDAEGKRIFADEDIPALGKKSGAALERVFEVARKLSGLRNEDIEELAGNSNSGQSD